MDGPLKGQTITLNDGITRIGRREGNDWILADGSVSGTHCEIEKTNEGFLIRDLGSTNGTKVNGEDAKDKYVYRNDVIYIGEVPVTIDGDDIARSEDGTDMPTAIPRTTIVIRPKKNIEMPKDFQKRSSSNKIWVSIIIILLLTIAGLMVKLFVGAD